MGNLNKSIVFDGKIFAALSHRNEQTVLGTAWRIIMDNGVTLALIPFQTPKLVPANPGVVPGDICSALSDLAGLAFEVLRAYMPQEGTTEYDDVPLGGWVEYAEKRLELHDESAENAALDLIQARNLRWNGKRLSADELRELRDVFFSIGRSNADNPNCSHDVLRYALTMWKEISGHDPAESIVLAYAERMPSIINDTVQRTAEAEGMSREDARRLVMQRVHYVAELGMLSDDGHHYDSFVLLQSAQCTVYNKEDVELLEKAGLSNQKREGKNKQEIADLSDDRLSAWLKKEEGKLGGLTAAQREAAEGRKKVPKLRGEIVNHYRGLRKERSKAEAARLTRKWMARSKKAGGLGITAIELPVEETIMRWAGEKK